MGMAELAETLFEETRERVEKAGVTLLDVEVIPRGRTLFRFVIDAEGGATIDDCVRVDRILTGYFQESDRVFGNYTVEVTSPGLERKLRRREEYDHFRGRRVQVIAPLGEGTQQEIRGVLEGTEGNEVLLLCDDETMRIPFDLIAKAKLLYDEGKNTTSGRGR
jgi:ribosome maturation factor RimP